MSSRIALSVTVTLAFALSCGGVLAQMRFFARVAPNREIAGVTADLYAPGTGAFRAAAAMIERRERHTATLLPDGKVLIAGGFNGSYLPTAEIYDPATGTFTPTGEMNESRRSHTATLLANGKVLIAGGSNGKPVISAEIYDPGTGQFKKTFSGMTTSRTGHTATLLNDGTVLIAGGHDGTNYLATAEIYNPVTGTFTATDAVMTVGRQDHTATLLADGNVLIAGGRDISSVLDLAETFTPDDDSDNDDTSLFTVTANDLTAERMGHTATLLPGGRVLIAGGRSEESFLSSAELYDPGSRTFAATGAMSTARYMHAAVILGDGRVLVTGGSNGASALDTAEIFDGAGSFSSAATMTAARIGHTTTLLSDGTPFLAGGQNSLPLEFDINLDQTDNVAPNIVFSADSKRGFVPYAGSGVVLAFSAETGQTLARIATGGKPAHLTLLDGRHLAAVSAFDNRIFVIDTESYQVASIYTFSGATFGFGSCLTLSPDGTVGYISSTGSGEVLKFAADSGKELGRLSGLNTPAQTTISPDGALLFIVDTSANRIACADAAGLSNKYVIDAREAEEKAAGLTSYATFTIFNRVVLTAEGDVAIAVSRDGNDSTASGKAFVFNSATGEILDVRGVGTQPGFTGLTPNGADWVIRNESTLTIVPTTDPGAAFEVATAGTNTVGSANIAFSPDSTYAYYASSDDDSAYQHHLATLAVCGKVQVGDDPNSAVDQPSTVALTPDGRVLAVLNFVSGEVELMKNTRRISATKYVNSADRFTGLTLINLSSEPAEVELYAFDNYGTLLSGDEITDPVGLAIPPNGQYSSTVDQIFGFGYDKESTGWLTVSTDEEKIVGYISTGRIKATWLGFIMDEMDGYPMFREPLHEWIAPEVSREGKDLDSDGDKDQKDFNAELNIVNPSYTQLTYDSARKAMQGVSLITTDGTVAYPTNRQSETVPAAVAGTGFGSVLISGGRSSSTATVDTAELFSPESNVFTSTEQMNAKREGHTATSLLDGRVLLAGGKDSTTILSNAETYDPGDEDGDGELFTYTAGAMNMDRVRHSATLMSDGRVLIAGGQSSNGINNTAEIYDPDADVFALTGGAMTAPRDSHTATLLANGKILFAGGTDGSAVTNTAELYDPSRGTFSPTGTMTVARSLHTATRLANGKVLIAGGYNGGYLSSAELYDPMTGTFATVGGLRDARASHTATLLDSGRVLIAGGTNGSVSLDSVESLNPETGVFEPAGRLNYPRADHTATLLNNGKVLIAGGIDAGEELETAEIYDPDYGTFTETEELLEVRGYHTATLLQSESAGAGYFRMSSTGGLLVTELYGTTGTLAALNGIDLQRWGIRRLYSPHVAAGRGWKTILNLINANGEGADVTITLHGADGSIAGEPYKRFMAPGEQVREELASIFGSPSLNDASGWLEIESTKDLINGSVSFTNETGTLLTSFELSGTPLQDIVIPMAAQDAAFSTAIAILNSNPETAIYTLELWNPDGTLDRSITESLVPGNRTARYLAEYFPGLAARLDGHIRIHSDRPLHALGLMHDPGLNFLSALPPIALP